MPFRETRVMTRGAAVKAGRALIITAGIAVGLMALVVAIFVAFTMTYEPCEFTVLEQAASPDGRLKAAAVKASCDATSGFFTRVVVTKASRPFRYRKDTVVDMAGLDTHVAWRGQRLLVRWRDDTAQGGHVPAVARSPLAPIDLVPLPAQTAAPPAPGHLAPHA